MVASDDDKEYDDNYEEEGRLDDDLLEDTGLGKKGGESTIGTPK
jgi:hypothetical protein